jgi:hypothetical protein
MSAWEDDEGRPKYQVSKFHTMAPTNADITTTSACCGVTMSLKPARMSAMVLATLTPRKDPAKFITAASTKATRGVRAWVETEVAMAFAAS